MSGVRHFEHVELGVPDLEEASTFYRDVVGMVQIAEQDGTVYFGCGLDANYDLALTQGEGIRHFAFRVESSEELAERERTLIDRGLDVTRCDGAEPGQVEGIRFSLPSGHQMEFVTVADHAYQVVAAPALPRRGGVLPIDNDHLGLMTTDVKGLSEFFRDTLDFRITEYVEPDEGSDFWVIGFVRSGPYHHDISIAHGDTTLHHYSLTLSSFEHLKNCCDLLAASGHRIEFGPSRRPAGSNLFIYVWLPGGHRVEFSAEMAFLHDDAPVRRLTSETSLDAWGDLWNRVPDSFYRGS